MKQQTNGKKSLLEECEDCAIGLLDPLPEIDPREYVPELSEVMIDRLNRFAFLRGALQVLEEPVTAPIVAGILFVYSKYRDLFEEDIVPLRELMNQKTPADTDRLACEVVNVFQKDCINSLVMKTYFPKADRQAKHPVFRKVFRPDNYFRPAA